MARKKPYEKKSFESKGNSNDVSANIYMTMILSEAWRDLSPKQQQLYLHMKLQYYGQSGKRAVETGNNTKFHFNKFLWHNTYNLYPKTADGRFYKDLKALIEHGFIKCVQSGQITRTKSIYQYSDKWQVWNTSLFKISAEDMNSSLIKELKKDN